jgi:phage-related protein
MPNDLGSQVYNLTMQHIITMYIIDFNPSLIFDPPSDGILYISAYKDGTNNIVYNGNTFEYVGLTGLGFRSEINGQLPEPQLIFDKNSLTSLPKYQQIKNKFTTETGKVFFDWRGAYVTRIKTTSNYLTSPTYSDIDSYVVDQVTKTTKSSIEVKLAVSIGADRITNISVQELSANRCNLRYRTYENGQFVYVDEEAGGCPYGNPTTKNDWSAVREFGTRYYTEQDGDTTDPAQDACSYTVKGCQLRFDPDLMGLSLPFTGIYKTIGK